MCGDPIFFFFGRKGTLLFDGPDFFKVFNLAIMVTREQAQVDALFKEFAFVFLGAETIENNSAKVLIDHNVEMFEVGQV